MRHIFLTVNCHLDHRRCKDPCAESEIEMQVMFRFTAPYALFISERCCSLEEEKKQNQNRFRALIVHTVPGPGYVINTDVNRQKQDKENHLVQ